MKDLRQEMFEKIGYWGPFSKKYFGISRIMDHKDEDGVRFDCVVSPAVENADSRVPNATVPVGVHPWHAKSDYSFYSYRYDLEWKDKVYADVSFTKLTDDSILIRTEFVNNSELVQICLLNLFSAIEFPFRQTVKPLVPDGALLIDALSYESFDYAISRPWDEETMDALRKGEFFDDSFTGHRGLGDRDSNRYILPKYPAFGKTKCDSVSYRFRKTAFNRPCLYIRYRSTGDENAEFILNGSIVTFPASKDLSVISFPFENTDTIKLVSEGTGGIELDFLAICEEGSEVSVKTEEINVHPEIKAEDTADGKILRYRYEGTDKDIVLRTFNPSTRLRDFNTGCLEDSPTSRISQSDPSFTNVLEPFSGSFSEKKSDPGYYHNAVVHSLYVEPSSTHVEYAVISYGETEYEDVVSYEKIYAEKLKTLENDELNESGRQYAFSNEILKATVFQNVVYPVYCHGDYIIHHTPGKRWDSFYTWDSGFIGMDMAEYAPELAEYILDTYLTGGTNPDYAFLLHGSPVPTHIYQLFEMFKKAENKDSLKDYYTGAKLFYDFLSGKIRKSTTDKFKTGLTTTFDYFYNCSGMDDLPPQKTMYEENKQMLAAPAISTSQLIRCAKILYILADYYGFEDEKKIYLEDIEKRTKALQEYSWDGEAGYFSYVIHDEEGNFREQYKNPDGENLDKGMDGVYPIVAGAVTKEQKDRILSHLKSEEEMFTPVGISAVDRTASYYIDNGYWNGNVWLSHQWFIWKTMLDLGESDFAFKIAQTALKAWKREVEYSYYTFEMFNIKSGRGGWFHNFGGLSTPVNLWTRAYYNPGSVSTGFDTVTEGISFNEDKTKASFSINHYGDNDFTVLVCMKERQDKYTVTVNGSQTDYTMRDNSALEISLKGDIKKSEINIY